MLFKKLLSDNSIKHFYQNAFQARLNIRLLLLVTVVQTFIVICTAAMIVFTKGFSFTSLFDLSLQSLVMCFFVTLVSGAAAVGYSIWYIKVNRHEEAAYYLHKENVT